MKMIAVSYLRCSSRSSAQDLRLRRHVDRRGRLIGDQQARLAGQRHGDHRALPQSAGQLPGIRIDALLRPSRCRRRGTARRSARAPAATADDRAIVQHDRLDDLRADRVHRAERRHRFLRDQRDLGAAQVAHHAGRAAGGARGRSVCRASAIQDLAAGDAAGRIDQLQDRPHRHALAAAAFADDADDLAGEHVEAHAIDRAHRAFVQSERHAQVAHAQQRRSAQLSGCRDRRHRAGRRPPG